MEKKLPFHVTPKILELTEQIGRELGTLEVSGLQQMDVRLRKANKVRTIQSSLAIEGNTLNLEEVGSIAEKKHVVGSKKDIKEVENAIEVYKDLKIWNALSEHSLLKAHGLLMEGLIEDNRAMAKKRRWDI